MRCPECHGSGKATMRLPAPPDMAVVMIVPCPACGGSGQASCCEGAIGGAGEVTNTGSSEGEPYGG